MGENQCGKNSDTCKSIPPGSCGQDCHGFEPKKNKKQVATRLHPDTIKDIKIFAAHKSISRAKFIELSVDCYKQRLLREMGK